MGCGNSAPVVPFSRIFIPNNAIDGQEEEVREEFRQMGLQTDTINKLYILYQSIDTLHTGQITLDQFYRYLRIDRSPFADRVLSLLDTTGTGTINFRNFVISMWNFCSMDNRSLLKFAFTLFDPDNLEMIEIEDFRTLVKEVYGTSLEHHTKMNKLIDDSIALTANDKSTGKITLESFRLLNQQFPHLLFPAFSLQSALRNAIIGEKFWIDQTQYRQTLDIDNINTIGTILDHPHVPHPLQGRGSKTIPPNPNETKEEKLQAEIDKLRSQRWMPSYAKPGEYVPTVARDSKAKAEARRKQLYGSKDITFDGTDDKDNDDNNNRNEKHHSKHGIKDKNTKSKTRVSDDGNYYDEDNNERTTITMNNEEETNNGKDNDEENDNDNNGSVASYSNKGNGGSAVYRNNQTKRKKRTSQSLKDHDIASSVIISTESILKDTYSKKGITNPTSYNNDDDEDEEFENPYPRPRNSLNTTSNKGLPPSASFAVSRSSFSNTTTNNNNNNKPYSGSMEYTTTKQRQQQHSRPSSSGSAHNYGNVPNGSSTSNYPSHGHPPRRTSNTSRRSSITGEDTAPDHHRHSISSGIANSRRVSAVSGSLNPDNIHNQGNRSRRKSSLANAQERAAAFAMMNV